MFSASKTAGPSGYNLTNSLRFRVSASAYLSRTPASAGNRRTYTWSAWVKRGALNGGGTDMCLFNAGTTSPNYDGFRIKSDTISFYQGGAVSVNLESTQVFRDPSAWYHLVLAVDTTQATAANRVKIYVNGNQVTAFGTANYPSLNAEAAINNTLVHNIAAQYANTSSSSFFDGYMDEINFIDGQALTPSSFGSTNSTTGVWQPARYSGTYGTNGFYLNFTDIGLTSGSNTGLGKDFSGNGNYWNTNNISVTAGTTYDAMSDVPTLTSATVANYATLNPNLRQTGTGQAPTSANLKLTANTTGYSQVCCATIASTSGKFYWEVTVNGGYGGFGIADSNNSAFTSVVCTTSSVTANPGQYTWGWNLEISNGNKQNNNVSTSYGSAASSGDVYMCAVDIDNGKVWWGKNGTWFASGNPASGTNAAFTNVSGNIIPYFSPTDAGGWTQDVNFGQRPFSYTPPTGFVRLNTYNLPDSTIKKGNTVMDATLYTGNGSTQTITNAAGFKPDFVWIKDRTSAVDNVLIDSVRGTFTSGGNPYYGRLFSNTTAAQNVSSLDTVTALNSNGFAVNSAGAGSYVNNTSDNYVGWQWQAGQGTNTTNTSGSITSTVSVNTTAGFSVVTYTGTGVAATIGHGLGVAPKFYIVKRRNASGDYWCCYHISIGATKGIYLNTSDAAGTSDLWNDTAPTSTVFSVKTTSGVNASGGTYVGYCWAEIAGFSRFGSYTGNGNADGPFLYTGFRPKFVMIKSTTQPENWFIMDSARNTYNVTSLELFPSVSNAETNGSTRGPPVIQDFLSNGFKIRGINPEMNQNGDSYIYMAFAENPLKNSLAR